MPCLERRVSLFGGVSNPDSGCQSSVLTITGDTDTSVVLYSVLHDLLNPVLGLGNQGVPWLIADILAPITELSVLVCLWVVSKVTNITLFDRGHLPGVVVCDLDPHTARCQSACAL